MLCVILHFARVGKRAFPVIALFLPLGKVVVSDLVDRCFLAMSPLVPILHELPNSDPVRLRKTQPPAEATVPLVARKNLRWCDQ